MKASKKEIQALIQKAKKLIRLRSKILEAELDTGIDFFKKSISDFYKGVREMQELFIEIPSLPLDDSISIDADTLEFLQRLLNNESFEDIEQKKS